MNRFTFFLYATLVTLLPAVALFPVFGANSAFLLLTGDAYLYLGIAENSTIDFFSFDGEQPTNGFHPLWQLYVWMLAQITSDPLVLMNLCAWSAVALCLTGIWLLGAATARITGSWLLAGLMTPGVYFLFAGQGLGNLTVWNFFSGMEAGLTLALTGLIAFTVAHFRPDETKLWMWLLLGTQLGILMLIRLDDVFVGPAIALCWLFWQPGQVWKRLLAAILLGLPAAVMLALYWAYNLSYIGELMPVSGAAKGGGALISNGWVTIATFLSPLIDLRAALTDYIPAHGVLRGAAFRVAEVVFPGLAALFFIFLIRRHFRSEPWAPIVAGMCGAIVIKAFYNFTAVNYWHQSAWYYAFAFGTISFASALMLAPALRRLRTVAPAVPVMLALLIAMVAFLQASQAYLSKRISPRFAETLALWEDRAQLENTLSLVAPDAKLLEFGDGMLNFAFERPVRHGFVFAGDTNSLAALEESRLLAASVADGYSLISSFDYLRWPEASTDRTSEDIRAFLAGSILDGRVKAELGAFDYEIVHVYEPLSIPFITLTPRTP